MFSTRHTRTDPVNLSACNCLTVMLAERAIANQTRIGAPTPLRIRLTCKSAIAWDRCLL